MLLLDFPKQAFPLTPRLSPSQPNTTGTTQHREPLHRYVVEASVVWLGVLVLWPCLVCFCPAPKPPPSQAKRSIPSVTPLSLSDHIHTGVGGGVAQQHKGMAEASKQYLTEVERRDMEMVRGVVEVGGGRSRVSGGSSRGQCLFSKACALRADIQSYQHCSSVFSSFSINQFASPLAACSKRHAHSPPLPPPFHSSTGANRVDAGG